MNYEVALNGLIRQCDLLPRFNYEKLQSNLGPNHQIALWRLKTLYNVIANGGKNDVNITGFNSNLGIENAPAVLRELIAKYLEIRDLPTTIMLCEHYVRQGYPGMQAVNDFLESVSEMLIEMRSLLQQRQERDVFLVALDSINQKHLKHMPYLSELAEKNFHFTNCHSASVYTRPCMRSMLTGDVNFNDDKTYAITVEESPLLQYFQNKDYYIYNFSGFRFFSQAMFPLILTKYKEGTFYGTYKKNEQVKYFTSSLLWSYLCEMVKGPIKPVFAITLLEEFHFPTIACWHEEQPVFFDRTLKYEKKRKYSKKDVARQTKEVLAWLDTQIRFFESMLPPNTMRIYTGDHGQLFGEYGHWGPGLTWHLDNSHVPLIITGMKGQYDKLFSRRQFPSLLTHYMENNNIEPEDQDFAIVKRDEIYDEKYKTEKLVKSLGKKYIYDWTQIIGDKDYFVKNGNGFKGYYLKDDEKTNLINDESYKNRITEMETYLE